MSSVLRADVSSDGVVAFESRNPAIDWAARWNYDKALDSPGGAVRESRRFVTMENGRMTFELCYTFPDETLVSKSQLRFLSRTDVEKGVVASGLRLENVLGNWNGEPFDDSLSDEMIFIALRSRENFG